jgi:threonine dehydrogenase-like Zn-dependent dehydrogenase
MKAVVKASPKPGVEVREVPPPSVEPGWTLIRMMACGICGSDVHIYEWTPGYEFMTPYMPAVIGHEFSGVVEEIGEGLTDLEVGDRVFAGPSQIYIPRRRTREYPRFDGYSYGPIASGGMAEYVLVPTDRLWRLPDSLSFEVGATIEPFVVAMQAVSTSEILPGESAVVLGPGPIGLLTLLGLKAAGVSVSVTGKATDRDRLKIAKALGAETTINVDEVDPVSEMKRLKGEAGVDVVFEATGVPSTIQQGLDMVKRRGKVIAIGIHPGPTSINMLDLVRSAKRVVGSYSGPNSLWVRVLALLRGGVIDLEPLISHRLSLNEAEKGFELCVRKECMKVLFKP